VSISLFVRLRALLPADWRGRAGERFRETADAISDFVQDVGVNPQDIPKTAVSLALDKLEGVAQKTKPPR
jgi:hypothetical protein